MGLQRYQTLQNRPNPPKQTPSPAGTQGPGPRPQQWPSIGFQSCRLPARKRSKTLQTLQSRLNPPNTLQTLQTPSATGTPGPRPLLKQAPRGQGPGPRPQQWLSIGFQSCRLPARKRSKTLQTLQNHHPPSTLQNPPNTFRHRHPRAKAAGTQGPGPRPQQWLSIGFQSCRLPARKRSKTLQTLQNRLNPPNTLPNPPNTFRHRHPRAKATSQTSTLGPRPWAKATAMAFYWLSKLPFASPQTLQNSPNAPKRARQGREVVDNKKYNNGSGISSSSKSLCSSRRKR